VRCIVRREDAIAYINRGPSIQDFLEHVEYAIVPDNTVPGAYEEALVGATYVIHVAGVWPTPVRDSILAKHDERSLIWNRTIILMMKYGILS
jgi:hypothetical protein